MSRTDTNFNDITVLFNDKFTQFDGVLLPTGIEIPSMRSLTPVGVGVSNPSPSFNSNTLNFNDSATLFNGGWNSNDASVSPGIRGNLY